MSMINLCKKRYKTEMKRYIFNKINVTDTITEALNIKNVTLGDDYEKQYTIYTKNSSKNGKKVKKNHIFLCNKCIYFKNHNYFL